MELLSSGAIWESPDFNEIKWRDKSGGDSHFRGLGGTPILEDRCCGGEGGRAPEYESDLHVPTRELKSRDLVYKLSSKKGVMQCGHQKNSVFFGVDSQKWGLFSVLKLNAILRQNLQQYITC